MAKEVIAIRREAEIELLTLREFIVVAAVCGLGFCSFGTDRHAALKTALFAGQDMSTHRGNAQKTHLKWDIFVAPSIPVVTNDFAPGEQNSPGRQSPRLSSTVRGTLLLSIPLSPRSRPELRPIGSPQQAKISRLSTQRTDTAITSLGRVCFWSVPPKHASWLPQARFK